MLKVLLIHPDEKFAGIYRNHLANHFLVDSAMDGLSGLRKIKTWEPQAVVSEHELPLVSGLTLLKFVRSHQILHSIPFIFLSALHPYHEALSLGASDWLNINEANPKIIIEKIYYNFDLNKKFITKQLYV